jgi:Zn-dependent peptidase ImmA (M78 family)/transcriptional regulator with XRE-family HTH domain
MSKVREFNGERLKEARYFKGLSITELATKLGISKQMVSKYETSKANPTAEILFKIVRLLDFSTEFYFNEDKFSERSNGTFYRSRFTSTQKQKSPSESIKRVITIYRDYLEQFINFPELSKPIIENLDELIENKKFETLSRLLRDFWGLGRRPIESMMVLLEEQGFVNALLPKEMEKVDAFGSHEFINDHNYYVILSKENSSFYRQQFSLAHELGHWLMHTDEIDPQALDPIEYRKRESEANDFASSFLLPKDEFIKDLDSMGKVTLANLLVLKEKWNVALSAMLMRASKLNAITEEEHLKMQKQISYRGWRKKEPLDEKIITRPLALKQATELIVDHDLVKASNIPLTINEQYGRLYDADFLEKAVGLSRGYLGLKNTKVITLKR